MLPPNMINIRETTKQLGAAQYFLDSPGFFKNNFPAVKINDAFTKQGDDL